MDEPEASKVAPDTVTRDNWVIAAVGIATICLFGTVVAIGIGWRNSEQAAAPGGSGARVTVEVTLGDLFVKPASIKVPSGSPVTFVVTNDGAMPHDFAVNGTKGTRMIEPGGKATLEAPAFTASTKAWCTVPGHKAAMTMDINVIGGSSNSEGNGSGTEVAASGAKIDPNAMPAVDWKPYDPALKPAPGGTEHKISLAAVETKVEVAPGVEQMRWTFNGKVSGPTLRGKLGDIFTVTLTNKGKIGHSIDFHASKVAPNVEMKTLQPGESIVYQFTANFAGIWMYHCGTAPALDHIGNGMFGAVIIDPPNLATVDHEFVMVQSELYLGPNGEPGDSTKMQKEQFDAVVFNGYYNQYKFQPIRVEPGQRVRVWVLDAGPSENSSFHIVGTIFDTIFKEGTIILRPDDRRGGAQSLDLQPAQGGYVEFSLDQAGMFPMVTHKFANVGKGALGLFQAGDVEPPAAGK